jgi:hypothetical protein
MKQVEVHLHCTLAAPTCFSRSYSSDIEKEWESLPGPGCHSLVTPICAGQDLKSDRVTGVTAQTWVGVTPIRGGISIRLLEFCSLRPSNSLIDTARDSNVRPGVDPAGQTAAANLGAVSDSAPVVTEGHRSHACGAMSLPALSRRSQQRGLCHATGELQARTAASASISTSWWS